MTGTLICWDGRRVVLPDLTSWRMEYACGIPCDSFYLECLWEPGEAGALAEAVRFAAEEDGERVFTGVVDEVCCGWDEDGARLSVSGRSMAALLLDVKPGDDAILLGQSETCEVTPDSLSADTEYGVNGWTTCQITARVPRIYVYNGQVVETRMLFC